MSHSFMFVPLHLRADVDRLVESKMIDAPNLPSMVGTNVRKWMYRVLDRGQAESVIKLALPNFKEIAFA